MRLDIIYEYEGTYIARALWKELDNLSKEMMIHVKDDIEVVVQSYVIFYFIFNR